jgi:hypothetical protein
LQQQHIRFSIQADIYISFFSFSRRLELLQFFIGSLTIVNISQLSQLFSTLWSLSALAKIFARLLAL